jgi:hypothetical protein
MKTIIAGSRSFTNPESIALAVETSGFAVTEVVSGTARGVDQLGELWAKQHSIPVKRFPANWDKFGKSAGYRRNEEMAQYADALVAIWDGYSRGTSHMIDLAKQLGLKVHVEIIR